VRSARGDGRGAEAVAFLRDRGGEVDLPAARGELGEVLLAAIGDALEDVVDLDLAQQGIVWVDFRGELRQTGDRRPSVGLNGEGGRASQRAFHSMESDLAVQCRKPHRRSHFDVFSATGSPTRKSDAP